jgi:hypothetical protein
METASNLGTGGISTTRVHAERESRLLTRGFGRSWKNTIFNNKLKQIRLDNRSRAIQQEKLLPF